MTISELITNSKIQDSQEEKFEISLRPRKFNEIIGREVEKQNLKLMIESAKKRKTVLDHIIFHGPPGLGKTSFAFVIANEMNTTVKITSGTALEKTGDIAAILTSIEEGGILFIDEIHRLKRTIEEVLYPAMEDNVLDIVVGKGPSAKTLRIDLPKFTIIGATTKLSSLSAPFRDRFGSQIRLDFYTDLELTELIIQKAERLGVKIDDEGALSIAKKSRGTPRIAIRILKRVRDYVVVNDFDLITKEKVDLCVGMLGIDENGLNDMDLKILNTIGNLFSNKPVGINTIAASIMEEADTVETVYEPFLLMKGYLKRTPKGRVITELGFSILERNNKI